MFHFTRELMLLILILFLGACQQQDTGLNPGNHPPRIELPDLEGKKHSLEDYRGKVVLLNFWASWCLPCVAELPALQNLYDQLRDSGFVVIAVGIDDDEASLAEFKRRFGLSFPVLVDKSGTVKSRYRISGVPESFVLDSEGKLVLFPDPQSDVPSIKIFGPREWSSPDMVARIKAFIDQEGR
ncbi:MAG: TlpA family protein disulfide reductase [Deltaproteobacteria bacterium]|nr:TlpA family protein disulfide reductase [Deltaproteobacteria bacterium]